MRGLLRDVADELREYEFGVGIAVGLLLAVVFIVAGSWLHGLAVIDVTGGAR